MYKAMIVDDEPIILKGLSRIIRWEEYGVEIAASACGGAEALALFDRLHVDILITDIKMYGMSGLELIQHIRERGLAVKIIILSGYDDFAYVKKAAQLGIENYLLKPIEEEELSATLQHTTEKLDRERKAAFRQRKDDGILRENILFRWLTGSIHESEFLSRAEFLGIGLKEAVYQVCIVRIVNRPLPGRENPTDYLPFGVQNICAELLADYGNSVVFNSLSGNTVLIFSGDARQIGIRRTADRLRAAVDQIHGCLHADLIGTVGPLESGYLSAPASYQKAERLLEYQVVYPANTVISYDTISRACAQASSTISVDYRSLKKAVLARDIAGTQQFIDTVYAKIRRSSYIAPDSIKNLAIEILYHVFGDLNIRQTPESLDDMPGKNIYEALRRYTLPDIFDWLKRTVAAYIRQTQAAESLRSPIIQSILNYIDRDYMREISLKSLSGLYHINAAYLGQLFKKETGQLFTNYLNHLRIEKAKEMLADTDMREIEIVNRIGYTSVHYFSNTFKKLVGVYPSEYKRSLDCRLNCAE